MSRYGLNLKLEYISIELISTYHISPLPGCSHSFASMYPKTYLHIMTKKNTIEHQVC